jgi:hypothetical protein
MIRNRALISFFLVCVNVCAAQQTSDRSEKSAPNATVSGRVYLGDTKTPGRKATVYLVPADALQADAPPNRNAGRHPDTGPVTEAVETRFDGSYFFAHVASGSYYVIATYPGYISGFEALNSAEGRAMHGEWSPLSPQRKAARDKVLESLARIDVQAGLPANADVTLERGAAVSGTITFDDGAPAAGLRVTLLVRMTANGKEGWDQIAGLRFGLAAFPWVVTDDRGNYRISGLTPGKYAIEAEVEFSDGTQYYSAAGAGRSSGSRTAWLPIYLGNTPRQKDAKSFTLQSGEERSGEDIVIPMSKLHTIKGYIVSADDGHVVNGGQVMLVDAADGSDVAQDHLSEDHPGFTLSFVFEGDYVLKVLGAADVDFVPRDGSGGFQSPQFDAKITHLYGGASTALHVDGDVDGVTIAVPAPTTKEIQMYQELMQQQGEQKPITIPAPQ